MLTLYWSCFLIGGVFVLLAVVGGIDGVEFELDELGLDSDVEIFDQTSRPSSTFDSISPKSRKFPLIGLIKSLKFWTFGSCFFGLTGILLSFLQTGLPAIAVTLLSIVMGLICGTGISGLLLYFRHQQADSLISHDDLMGLAGTVEIPFDAQTRGKVRLKVKGSILEVVAFTDGNRSFQPGEQVVVVGTQENRVWVVSSDSFNQPPDALGSGTP